MFEPRDLRQRGANSAQKPLIWGEQRQLQFPHRKTVFQNLRNNKFNNPYFELYPFLRNNHCQPCNIFEDSMPVITPNAIKDELSINRTTIFLFIIHCHCSKLIVACFSTFRRLQMQQISRSKVKIGLEWGTKARIVLVALLKNNYS